MCAAVVVLALICLLAGVLVLPLREHLLGPAGDALINGAAVGVGLGGTP